MLKGYGWLKDEITADKIDKVKKLARIARRVGATLPQFAIAWCARNEHVSTVITGASRLEQLQENLRALEILPHLTPEVLLEVDRIVGKPKLEDD